LGQFYKTELVSVSKIQPDHHTFMAMEMRIIIKSTIIKM